VRFLTVYQRLFRAYGPQYWWPGETPFEVIVGAVLTQNTAWSNVEKALANLKAAEVLDAERIIALSPQRLAHWLTPSGYFNIKAQRLRNLCAWYLSQGAFQQLRRWHTKRLRKALLSVNGVGFETADDILLYAFKRPVFVIDAYTRRIFARLGLVDHTAPYEHLRQLFQETLTEGQGATSRQRQVALYNEYHALIVIHGKEICRQRPRCAQCCLRARCPARSEYF